MIDFKMRPIRLLLLILPLFAFFACQNKTDDQTSAAVVVDSTASAPKVQMLEVKYDDVRLRESAGMGGEVLATFKMGEKLKDLGERSENEETVELRGVKKTAPWFKVEASDGKQGWIFGGAVAPFKEPDPVVAELSKALEALDKNDCSSLATAVKLFEDKLKGKPAPIADEAVPALQNFLGVVVNNVDQQFHERPNNAEFEVLFYNEDKKPLSKKVLDQKLKWEQCGLTFIYPEGMMGIVLRPGYALTTLEGMVTEPMKSYLKEKKLEDANMWAEDAGLSITVKELAERCVFWDDFLVKYPDFVFVNEITDTRKYYVAGLIMGLDNTPSLTEEGLSEEFKTTYDWVLKEHPTSETAKVVKEWNDLLKTSKGKRNKKTDDFGAKLWE